MQTRGVVYIHSVMPAISPHIEWAIAGVLGTRVVLSWKAQSALPGTVRAEADWTGEPGTAGRLAAALRAWPMVRFEITEEASPGSDGERICHIPGRPVWRTPMSANGDVMVTEDHLRSVIEQHGTADALRHALSELLGTSVDADLEEFRQAGEGGAVTWLHQVG